MTCAEFVELATEYLDGALDPETAWRFATHPDECPGCAVYLDQLCEIIVLLKDFS
jgi:hypothetical protein